MFQPLWSSKPPSMNTHMTFWMPLGKHLSFLNNNANSVYCLTYRPSILIYHGHLLLLEMLIILLFCFASIYICINVIGKTKIRCLYFFSFWFFFFFSWKQYYLGCMCISLVILLHYFYFHAFFLFWVTSLLIMEKQCYDPSLPISLCLFLV